MVSIGRSSAKAKALRAAGVASLCAQNEQLPFAFDTVDGPVVVDDTTADEGHRTRIVTGTSAPARSSRPKAATTYWRA